MKKNELMIGDWVQVLPISNKVKSHYDKIESIRKEYTGQIYIEGSYHDREHKNLEDWFDWSVGLDNLKPITLTSEILEKNGFKGNGYSFLELDDSSYLEYYYFEGRLRKICKNVDEWDNHNFVKHITFQCHCRYVHELQQALRLCGLSDLADNFKVDNANKVKPKFRVGDWIFHERSGNVFHINKIENCAYISDKGATISFSRQNDWRCWSIEDAKDGDVLFFTECYEPKNVFIIKTKGNPKKYYALSYYCFYDIFYHRFDDGTEKGCLAPNEEITPATKEQCDLLFQKIKEKGYEWDSKNKELIKK